MDIRIVAIFGVMRLGRGGVVYVRHGGGRSSLIAMLCSRLRRSVLVDTCDRGGGRVCLIASAARPRSLRSLSINLNSMALIVTRHREASPFAGKGGQSVGLRAPQISQGQAGARQCMPQAFARLQSGVSIVLACSHAPSELARRTPRSSKLSSWADCAGEKVRENYPRSQQWIVANTMLEACGWPRALQELRWPYQQCRDLILELYLVRNDEDAVAVL